MREEMRGMVFVLLIAGFVFIFGLAQWARSGAILWDIHSLSKLKAKDTADAETKESLREKETLQKSIRRMERTMDELLRSSLRVLGALALCVWFFILAAVVIDALNLDWLDRLSFTANRVLGNPSMRSGARRSNAPARNNNVLRSLGSGVRR